MTVEEVKQILIILDETALKNKPFMCATIYSDQIKAVWDYIHVLEQQNETNIENIYRTDVGVSGRCGYSGNTSESVNN